MAIATDDFNRLDNTDLGANWTPPTGADNYTINTNEALPVGGTAENAEYYNALTPGPAQYSKVILGTTVETHAGLGHGPAVRMATGARTYYQAMCNTTNIVLARLVAGVRTTLATYPIGCVSGDVVELYISAAHVITVWFDGTLAVTFDDSASAIATGRVGIAGEIFDNFGAITYWEGGDIPVAAAPTAPRVFSQTTRVMRKPVAVAPVINAAHPLASGLIGAFALYEATGAAVADLATGNAAEGTLSGTTPPTWAGVNDTGLKFAGGAALASYVALGAIVALQDLFLSVSKPGSIFIKGRMGATNAAGGLVGRNDDNLTTRGWNISLITGAKIEFASEATANMYTTIAAPAANTDFDLLITHDGSLTGANVAAYLNGAAVAVTVVANGTAPKTSDVADPLRFGTTTNFTTAGAFDGYLYEVLIYNRVLSAAEAVALHADAYAMMCALVPRAPLRQASSQQRGA